MSQQKCNTNQCIILESELPVADQPDI